ncbi:MULTISPECIES: DUF1028 domain-containing protein [unclassified Microbacterium]|uniref:DUF1028 domain-containing protein n=1 Tax=unclassified Microbacterium TaxID=2609290 RepID=UPI00214C030D|nr:MULTISPECIES: DUF1028 domain-containing protein [unclassified Microbacterium]MCR2810628.1 DUF1028 domain-containing protein [Microbacterium sp. zg.B185]WIM18165.1 DUF1028 domain-containing protein [Microbacterium sp. zg-B185]
MTYSIVARDPETGQLGVASQSHYFALGRVVTFAQAGVGAVATQSFVEPAYGPDGLASMADGASAEEAMAALVTADPERELRQVAMIDAAGTTARFTGDSCVAHRGDLAGDQVVVLGNMLANGDVVPAMLDAYVTASGDLADKILAAMDAAEAAGGDARGRMSASLVVVDGTAGARPWSNRIMDVRVDDAEFPLVELRRLVGLSRAHTVFGNAVFTPGLLSRDTPTTGEALQAAILALDTAAETIGADPEPTLWKGVLLARAGDDAGASAALRSAVERRGILREYVDNLHAAAILPKSAAAYLADV